MIRYIRENVARIQSDQTLSSLSKGFFISFGGQGLGFIFSTLLHVLIARVAGLSNYGLYAYTISWVLLFVMLSKFGSGSTLLRFVAAYEAKGDWGLLKGIIIRGHQFSFALNIIFGSVTFFLFYCLKDKIDPDISGVLIAAVLLGMAMTHLQIIAASLLSLRQVFFSKLVNPVLRPAIMVVIVTGSLLLSDKKITGFKLITFDVIATFILVILGVVFLINKLPDMVRTSKAKFNSREWIRITLPLFLLSALQIIMAQTDILMLGFFSGLKTVGVYNAVMKLCFILSYLLVSVSAVIAPLISRSYSLGEYDLIRKMFRFTRLLLAFFSIPLGIILFLFGDFFLSVFGETFTSGYTALRILVAGNLLNVIAGPVGFLFTMTANHISALKVFGTSLIIKLILSFVFIKLWGMNGAALASSISLVFWNVSLVILSKKKLGFSI